MLNDAAARGQTRHWDFNSLYRFGRFSAISFTWMTVLLGAATASPSAPVSLLATLAAIGVAFHLFAYIHNDVADLPLDRTEPKRGDSPLVRGMITPNLALLIALLQVPIAFALHFTLADTNPGSIGALALAFALLALYNARGKQWQIPIMGDFVQAAGWMALAGYGALTAGGAISLLTASLLTLILLYVLMINGIHGGLRDLANDYRCGARTTAILLGARPDETAGQGLPAKLTCYALGLQTLISVAIAAGLGLNIASYRTDSLYATAALVAGVHLALVCVSRNAFVESASEVQLIQAGLLHLLISLGLLYWPFALYFSWSVSLTILAAYVLPVGFMCVHDGLRYEAR